MSETKICPCCAETVKLAARLCRFCGYNFETGQDPVVFPKSAAAPEATKDTPPDRTKGAPIGPAGFTNTSHATGSSFTARSSRRQSAGAYILAVALVIVVIAQFTSSNDDAAPHSASATASTAQASSAASRNGGEDNQEQSAPEADPEPQIVSNWNYDQKFDELRRAHIYYARILSNNRAYFDFPYSGGSSLSITIRKHPEMGQDVIFTISSGQFDCSSWDGCSGKISIDGKVEKLTLSTSSSGSHDVLFATYGEAILRKLKSSKKVIVELPFYQHGRVQFDFDTSNLQWPPKT